jgi:predicted ATPase
MSFANPAGWHVLIGDNGSGKSSIIRALALALVGPEQALGLRADWRDWLNLQSTSGSIHLEVIWSDQDQRTPIVGGKPESYHTVPNHLEFTRLSDNVSVSMKSSTDIENWRDPRNYNWGDGAGWFSVAYGPYRRFAGGNNEWTKVFFSQPKLGAHLSAFGEDVALTEAIDWLVKLNYLVLEGKESSNVIQWIKNLVNSNNFLPSNAKIDSISSDGVIFIDGNNAIVNVNQLSDGYRSILSLTFELIRQLVRVYGSDKVFENIRNGEMHINLPGIVLIDEIDAHLHPTWQTRIGQWFTGCFPEIQFIVTSHSPLVCRASENGSVWRLAAAGSETSSGEVTGQERDKLIFGNILDAYGTEIFGKTPVRSEKSNEKLERLGKLNMLSALGQISNDEEKERLSLQQVLTTDDPTGF